VDRGAFDFVHYALGCFYMYDKNSTILDFSLDLIETSQQPLPRSYQKLVLCKHTQGFGEYVNFSNRALCYEIGFNALKNNQYLPKVQNKHHLSSSHLVQKVSQIDPSQITDYYHLYCKFQTPCGNIQTVRI